MFREPFYCVANTFRLVKENQHNYILRTNMDKSTKRHKQKVAKIQEEGYLQFSVLQRLFPKEAQIRQWCLQGQVFVDCCDRGRTGEEAVTVGQVSIGNCYTVHTVSTYCILSFHLVASEQRICFPQYKQLVRYVK